MILVQSFPLPHPFFPISPLVALSISLFIFSSLTPSSGYFQSTALQLRILAYLWLIFPVPIFLTFPELFSTSLLPPLLVSSVVAVRQLETI